MNDFTAEYVYCGDKLTAPDWRGLPVQAVRRVDGKCVRGRNGNMLVENAQGERCNVLGRLLVKRKVSDVELSIRAGLADIAAGRVKQITCAADLLHSEDEQRRMRGG